ncbi:MAG: hypothetical protein NC417_10280 [Candidatus Gastranaerophilales bacterium]|nr:hypothetical protein [Candidatus Gastranaerophilales bacterium]
MIFKCKNCGGNVVYSPEKRAMYCPFCESTDSQEKKEFEENDLKVCPNCGGEVPVLEHTSATQCPYCDNYLIFDQRVEGEYTPKWIIPFQLGKETCKNVFREKFKKYLFAPTDFLAEVRLNKIRGTYVPYWFYDYDINCDFQGEGTKVRSWTSGDRRYTETSYYGLIRNMDVDFQNIPVDASVAMPDNVMDLMEPFGYEQLEAFHEEYLSGFYAEKYNMTADIVESRALQKRDQDIAAMLRATYSGYGNVRTQHQNVSVRRQSNCYGLLPVWKYDYEYKGKSYPFYVNGQTGKIVGTVPVSGTKVWAYAGTLGLCLMLIMDLINLILRLL